MSPRPGPTGRAIRKRGPICQVLAAYVITSPHANMLGLYSLPLAYISADTGLSVDEINEGLAALDELGFARYERTDEVIWVCEMAKWQLGVLKGGDKRFIGVRKVFNSLPIGPFTQAFVDRYGREFGIAMPLATVPPGETEPLARASQAFPSPC